MSTRHVYLCMIALLASSGIAIPHDESVLPNSAVIDQQPLTNISTKTVFVTVTYTSYTTEWPSGATSLVLPTFIYDPLPSSLGSGSLPVLDSTTITGTFATSASPTGLTDASTTCSHTMSHIVPGNSPWVPKLPWITPSGGFRNVSSLPVTSVSATESPTLLMSTMSKIQTSSSVLPVPIVSGPDSSEFNWPTRTDITPRSSAIAALPSTSPETTVSISLPESSSITTTTASSSPFSGTSAHPRCKVKSAQVLTAETSIRARDAATDVITITTIPSSVLSWKTKHINASSSARTKSATRSEESKANKRRMSYWFRFFAAAEPSVGRAVKECLACDRDGEVTCLPARRYSWCTGGCASTRKLGCDMVCEDGVIRKEGQYCVR